MSIVSLIISFIFSIPLGVFVCETRPQGLFQNKIINSILNRIIDIGRSIPFVLLVVFLFPFTRWIVGTAIGTTAMLIPLTITAIPFEARLIEEFLSQIPKETIEASMIDGANKIQIIIFIKLKSKLSLLVNTMGISLINIIGQSAMAGVVGAGGLGNYAIVYGFQRFNYPVILKSLLVIIIIIVGIQVLCNICVRLLERSSM